MAIHIYRSRAYWSETDAAGIVHFSNFFRYCERAEEDFWLDRYVGRYGTWGGDILFLRVRAEADFHFPIYPYDLFRVEMVDILLGRSSITYRYKIFNESRGDRLSAECSITVVAVDKKYMKSTEIPVDIRRFLLECGAREKQ